MQDGEALSLQVKTGNTSPRDCGDASITLTFVNMEVLNPC